jgi:SPP1 family predicted phage head-tail adaptor
MRAGKLRHRLAIMQPTRTITTDRDSVPTYTEVAVVWGAVEPLSGRELFAAQAVRADVTHVITLRYNAELRPHHRIEMRIGVTTRTFECGPPLSTEERRRDLVITAVELYGEPDG